MRANFLAAKGYFQWDLIQQSAIYIFIENNWYTAMAVNCYYLSVYFFQITLFSDTQTFKVCTVSL